MSPRASRRTATFLVCALTAFALALRLVAIDYRLPHTTLGDERYYAGLFELLERGGSDPQRNEYYGIYPQLVPRVALLVSTRAHAAAETLAEHLARAASNVLLLRIVVASLSVLIVPATYRIARRFLDRPAAVLAAGLVATSFLSVWFSPQARPHAALAAFTAIGLCAALALRRRGDFGRWIVAGLSAAATIGALHSGVFVLGPFFLAYVLSGRARRGRRKRGALGPLAALALVAAGVGAFYPFLLFAHDPQSAPPSVTTVEHIVTNISGTGFVHAGHAAWSYDPVLSVLVVLSLALALAGRVGRPGRGLRGMLATERGADLALLLAFALPYALAFGAFEFTQQRYLLPLLPLAACAAAGSLARACDLVRTRRPSWGSAPFVAAAVLVVALQSAFALALVRVRAADDTAEQAAAWVAAHAGEARIAVLPGLELPLVRDASGLVWLAQFADLVEHPWLDYQTGLAPSERERLGRPITTLPVRHAQRSAIEEDFEGYLADVAADYLVIEVFEPARGPLFARLRAQLLARGAPIARFSPWRAAPDDERPFVANDAVEPDRITGDWAYHALRADRLGPVVEIYRVARGAALR